MNAPNTETVKRIRQIRADAMLGKKKHYNAADRKQRYQTQLGIVVIGINIFLGSAVLILLKQTIPEWAKWLGGGLALSAALLSGIQNYFGFSKATQGHRAVAGRYLDVVKLCSNALAAHADGTTSESQLAKKVDSLTSSMTKIDSDAHAFTTNNADFDRARKGVEDGEETYSDNDLRLGD